MASLYIFRVEEDMSEMKRLSLSEVDCSGTKD